MPTSRLAFDPITMDVRMQANPNLYFGVNGGHDGADRNSHSKPFEDKALHFLSQEEQDCILFFEETIDSLLTTPAVDELDGPGPPIRASAPSLSPVPPFSASNRPTSPKDIIDLVRPAQPDLVHPTHAPFNPPMPDFTQNMVMNNPERHFENKPRREVMENFPTEYNLPPPGKDSAPYGHALYQPVGSVPTPVRIAQKIAEHQGSVGNTNILSSSLLSNCRRNLDLENVERPPTSPDYLIKQDPTTSAKPTHYPNNINMIMGSNQHHSHSLASVNLQDRKSQMLANLSGTSHPVEAEELHGLQEAQVNLPTHSVSFRDPTPNKSRMEALSKLGLTRNLTHNSSTNTKPAAAPIPVATPTPVPMPTLTPVSKPDVARQAKTLPPATVNTNTSHASIHDNKPASPSPEVSSKDFNSYGGKTIVVNPSKAAAVAPSTGGHGSKAQPVTSHSDFNPYGGKTKVMKPAPVTTTRADLTQPDIESRAVPPPASTPARVMPPPVSTSTPARVMSPPASTPARVMPSPASTPARVMPSPASTPARVMPSPASTPARVMPSPASTPARVMPSPASTSTPAKRMPPPTSTSIPTKGETMSYEVKSYGGKTRMVTPSHTTPSPVTTPDILTHTLVRSPSKASAPVPSPASRPFRYSTPPSANRAGASPPSPESRPKSISKPSFRSQGITVQFSGRGVTDESRREALRKLGLLKDTF
ncbi:proline and serine-rich protein 2 [Salmo salar]|uniref:Proline and serine-rich protein 2 n=1 Tax=Salmo salar TaxID=8030 RepID=A0A1S3MYR2_SALSA|nr:proline and serine-rich protein 2-like [Salmo salar]|eukprot:XP_014008297.1 PREDICTED: proline and serine-rich protein 2-like [Salmo salar]